MEAKPAELIAKIQAGNRHALARAITQVENGGPEAQTLLAGLPSKTYAARRIGITGPPGAGKSSLSACIAQQLSEQGRSVGILAIDPSSPFTQGAVLGDRVRMLDLDNVYIRSLASRGQGGGLGLNTDDVIEIMDAAGFDDILIETVGIGQAELDIRPLVDTLAVVLVPESGDNIQAIKAGLMEIADIYIMNKSDRPGSHSAAQAVQASLGHQQYLNENWKPSLIITCATMNDGIDDLLEQITHHTQHLHDSRLGENRLKQRVSDRLHKLMEQKVIQAHKQKLNGIKIDSVVDEIIQNKTSVHQQAEKIIKKLST